MDNTQDHLDQYNMLSIGKIIMEDDIKEYCETLHKEAMQLLRNKQFNESYSVYKDILFYEPENIKYQVFANQIKMIIKRKSERVAV